ncbi:hypothetical protein MYX82_12640, partial [Acidobacteria bacterium AH-259-D05]|nr:hypothetical protein [Acidobacteria bacterium AH-259-D05]
FGVLSGIARSPINTGACSRKFTIYGGENGWGVLTHHKKASNHGCNFIHSGRSWKRGWEVYNLIE